MRVHLKNDGYALSAEFPMTVFEMQDALDKLQIPPETRAVTFQIYDFRNMNLSSELCEKEFTADIFRLNLFVERLENLDDTEMAAMKSLLQTYPESDFEDMLLMTYGLDSVMVYPCEDCRELGETVIGNELLPELESCSDEILELLDCEKVGQLMQEREDGVFVDGYYCVTSGYEPPDIHFEFGEPEQCFFRLLIAPDAQKTAQAQWISLPCNAETLLEVYDQTCCELQSSLPWITSDSLKNMHQIGILNALAERMSELSHNDFVKLKAVMDSKRTREIPDALACMEHLPEYEWDRSVRDCSEFGRAYLAKNLPTNFDISLLKSGDFYDFGSQIMKQTGSAVTSYGVISGRGQSLYSVLTMQPEQQLEEDMEEDFEMKIGGLSL